MIADELHLPERYRVVRLLGEGGMGAVYEAVDRERDTRVAIKVLHERSGDALVKLRNEFRALAAVRHPNVCQFGELFEAGGTFAFAMELVDGTPFCDAVTRDAGRGTFAPIDAPTARIAHDATVRGAASSGARYDEPRLRAALIGLVQGLAAIHDAGFVHRDLKPSNVVITPAGRVVILDFGLAASTAQLAHGVEMAGTVDYMAPEQLRDDVPITAASDLYGVGALLYEALVGRPPYGGSVMEVMAAKQQHAPTAPRALFAEIPAELDRLCMDLLALDPALRPDARAVLAALSATAPARRATSAQPVVDGPLIGRAAELADLRAAFDDLEQGSPIVVQVNGAPGIGKSALLAAFASAVADEALLICVGRCHEREYVRYNSWEPVIDGLSRWLSAQSREARAAWISAAESAAIARLFPTFERLAPAGTAGEPSLVLRELAVGALRDVLARVGEVGRVVVIVDDLQWGTREAFELFLELMEAPAPRLLFVRGVRTSPDYADELRARIVRIAALGVDLRNVYLRPLDDDDARALARRLRAAMTDAELDELVVTAGGNPLVIEELATVPTVAVGRTRSRDVAGVVDVRLAHLSAPLRQLVRLLALAPGGLAYGTLERAAGIEHADAVARVEQLRELRLVRARGVRRNDRVELAHHQLHVAALAGLGVAERTAAHAALGAAADAEPGAPTELRVHHWVHAGEPERALAAIVALETAAHDALGFARAARAVEGVLAMRLAVPVRVRATRVYGDLLARAGEASRAADAYRAAAELSGTPAEQLDLERLAAEYFLRCGRVAEGIPLAHAVGERIGIAIDGAPTRTLVGIVVERVRLRVGGATWRPRAETSIAELDACHSLASGLALYDFRIAALAQTRAARLAFACPDRARAARAIALEAAFAATPGERAAPRAAAILAVATEVAAGATAVEIPGHLAIARALCAHLRGDHAEAVAACEDARTYFRERCAGLVWEAHGSEVFALWSLAWLGRWGAVRQRSAALARDGESTGDAFAATFAAIGHALVGELAHHDLAAARARTAAAMAAYAGTGFQTPHLQALLGEVAIDLQDERAGAAYDRIEAAWPAVTGSGILRIQEVAVSAWSARARAALATLDRHPERAREVLECADTLARVGWAQGLVALARAGVAALRGDQARADAWLGTAIATADARGLALVAAAARWRRARLLGGEVGAQLSVAARTAAAELGVVAVERVFAALAPWPADR